MMSGLAAAAQLELSIMFLLRPRPKCVLVCRSGNTVNQQVKSANQNPYRGINLSYAVAQHSRHARGSRWHKMAHTFASYFFLQVSEDERWTVFRLLISRADGEDSYHSNLLLEYALKSSDYTTAMGRSVASNSRYKSLSGDIHGS